MNYRLEKSVKSRFSLKSFSILRCMRMVFVLLFLAMSVFAGVLEDKPGTFVVLDSVRNASLSPCENGTRFIPENISYRAHSMIPYRVYRVGLPNSKKPFVSIQDISTKKLSTYCSEDSLNFVNILVETPIFRDGVWMSDIWVPLLIGSRQALAYREQFKLSVQFAGNASGKNPGKRALFKVANPKATSVYGQTEKTPVLRKSTTDFSDVEWLVRIAVGDKNPALTSENGLYGVSYRELRSALLSVGKATAIDGIRISALKLYGASADTLSEMPKNISSHIPGKNLQELPLDIRDKNTNGIFDDGDSLYFVGYGTSIWKRMDIENPLYAVSPMQYYFSSSPYSFFQYFHLAYQTSGETKSLKEQKLYSMAGAKELEFLRYVRAERDLLLRDTYFGREGGAWETASGKEWFWAWNLPNATANLSNGELRQSQTETLPGLISEKPSYVSFSFFPMRSTGVSDLGDGIIQTIDNLASAKSYEQRMEYVNLKATINGTPFESFDLLLGGNFVTPVSKLKKSGNEFSLSILPSEGRFVRFDGYSLAYPWKPSTDSSDWILPGKVSGKIKIPVASGNSLMKFKGHIPVVALKVENGYAVDSVNASEDVQYLLYRSNKVLAPAFIEGIPVRKSGTLARPERISSKTEYLIIAPEAFQNQALRLAEFRAGEEVSFPLKTTLVLAEDIYRLYSGGSISPEAIRDYLIYARSICPNLRYVLLAGAAHYDYRGMSNSLPKIRIPAFEKEDAVVEDFYAVLDSGESIRYGEYDLDLAIGRLPVQTENEFENYLEKIYLHEKKLVQDNGIWRNTLVFAADDSKNGAEMDYQKHTSSIENLALSLDSIGIKNHKQFIQKKIYLLDYEEDATGQKPEAATDLLDAINQGALFTIYFGHGSLSDWASEGLLKPAYFSRISNEGRYTILSSFSCSLARFDKGDELSLSEQFVRERKKGSILSIGASRQSYGGPNESLAKNLMYHALGDSAIRIGEALVRGKGLAKTEYSFARYNNERYVLLGEPVVSMPVEKFDIQLDQKIDSLLSLDKMTISGKIKGTDENGKLFLSIREGFKNKTLSYEPATEDSVTVSYAGSLIYSEEIPVRSGRFSTEFITPQKIAFGDTAAEVSAYFYSEKSPYVAHFLKSGILIAGTSSYADSLKDETAPEIKITTCGASNESYLAEGQTIRLETPACLLVSAEDSTALDFSDGADEGFSFEVAKITSPFHPWPYLEQSAKKVSAKMNFPENSYPPGIYEFKVRAQDILGNVAKKTVKVEITEKLKAGLADVFNAPNPMGKKGTTFYFKDLAVGRSAKVTIFIYNQNGRLVQRISNAKSGVTHWNGKDFYGRLLANGLYHYVVRSEVPATESSKKKTFVKKQKLLISR